MRTCLAAVCGTAAAIVMLLPAAAAAGHGAASYENQLKAAEKKRKSQAPAVAPAAPAAAPAAPPPPPATGDRDHDFATAMRRHHAEAVVLAEEQISNGSDPQLQALARRTLETHRRELAELDRWLSEHPQPRAAK